jgi:hypothetical protein
MLLYLVTRRIVNKINQRKKAPLMSGRRWQAGKGRRGGGGGLHGCSGGVAGYKVRCGYVCDLVLVKLGVLLASVTILKQLYSGSGMRRCNLSQGFNFIVECRVKR